MAEARDPWSERLSPWLEGELAETEARALEAHVAGCAACARELEELQRIVAAARALGARAGGPERDLWAGIEVALRAEERGGASLGADATRAARGRGGRRWVWLAAGLVAGFLIALAWRGTPGERGAELAAGERYLLLLHEGPDLLAGASAAEVAAVVDEYRRWAEELGHAGRLVAGEKLADAEGRWVRPAAAAGAAEVAARPERGGIGGFFVVRAASYDEALAITRTCPHRAHGGWIELRRIET